MPDIIYTSKNGKIKNVWTSSSFLEEWTANDYISGDFVICDNEEIEHLPAKMYIKGNLVLKNLQSLKHLDSGIYVEGDILIENCSVLSRIDNIKAQGDIKITDCQSLHTIGDDFDDSSIQANGNIVIYNCISLDGIFGCIQADALEIHACYALEDLDANIILTDNLYIINCNLKRILSPVLLCNDLLLKGNIRFKSFEDSSQIKIRGKYINPKGEIVSGNDYRKQELCCANPFVAIGVATLFVTLAILVKKKVLK